MDLQSVAYRIANKNMQLIGMIRTASKKAPPCTILPCCPIGSADGLQVGDLVATAVDPCRALSSCQSETVVRNDKRNLTQDEFIATHKMAGEPQLDFADVMAYADDHDMNPEEVFTWVTDIMKS